MRWSDYREGGGGGVRRQNLSWMTGPSGPRLQPMRDGAPQKFHGAPQKFEPDRSLYITSIQAAAATTCPPTQPTFSLQIPHTPPLCLFPSTTSQYTTISRCGCIPSSCLNRYSRHLPGPCAPALGYPPRLASERSSLRHGQAPRKPPSSDRNSRRHRQAPSPGYLVQDGIATRPSLPQRRIRSKRRTKNPPRKPRPRKPKELRTRKPS